MMPTVAAMMVPPNTVIPSKVSHEFNNGLEELQSSGFMVNVFNVMLGDHPAYRRL
ncbi:hypothetical protein [Halioglobus japonicus]|uniref:hypothetical protein n=1 Tax=Halioglobus japonicus TaxID=930805 RepID=UPI0015E132E1|nr:hypothetical protein [Halioglobus japonicus]